MREPIEIEPYESRDPNPKQRYRWRAIARNGKIVADSGEGYATPAGLERAIDRFTSIMSTGQWKVRPLKRLDG